MQASGRRVSYHTFAHVLALDMQFHLQRRTGSLSRMIERGAPRPCRPSCCCLEAQPPEWPDAGKLSSWSQRP